MSKLNKVVYSIPRAEAEREKEWLNLQRVYPSFHHQYDWVTQKETTLVGVITDEETVVAIKLRHNIAEFTKYK